MSFGRIKIRNSDKKTSKLCKYCNLEFKGRPKQKYCSAECSNKAKTKGCFIKCSWCNKEIWSRPSQKLRKKFCSRKCFGKGKKNKPRKGKWSNCICGKNVYSFPSELKKNRFCSRVCAWKNKIKGKDLICKICKKKYYRPPSQIKYRGSSFCSKKCSGVFISKFKKGKNSYMWKGGRSSKLKRLRNSKKWALWREKVFKRDNYTCQKCKQRGGYLEPHHIKEFAFYPKLRWVIKNGITLCKECHNKTKKDYTNFYETTINRNS